MVTPTPQSVKTGWSDIDCGQGANLIDFTNLTAPVEFTGSGLKRVSTDIGSPDILRSVDNASSASPTGSETKAGAAQATFNGGKNLFGGNPRTAGDTSGRKPEFTTWPIPEPRQFSQRYDRSAYHGRGQSSMRRGYNDRGGGGSDQSRGRGADHGGARGNNQGGSRGNNWGGSRDNNAGGSREYNHSSSRGGNQGSPDIHFFSDGSSSWAPNSSEDWQKYQQCKAKLSTLPAGAWTGEVYKAFKEFGTIVRIEVHQNKSCAWVTFQPPPSPDVWYKAVEVASTAVTVQPVPGPPSLTASPIHPGKFYSSVNIFFTDSINLGTLTSEHAMTIMRTASAVNKVRMTLTLGDRKELDFQFPYRINDKQRNFRFRLPLPLIDVIYQVNMPGKNQFALVIPFGKPPRFFRQRKPDAINDTFNPNERVWNEWSTWNRKTDVVTHSDGLRLKHEPLTAYNDEAIIDIGRWTTYHLYLSKSLLQSPKYSDFKSGLTDHGVKIKTLDDFAFLQPTEQFVRTLLVEEVSGTHPHFKPLAKQESASNELSATQISLSFAVRYQLEVCTSSGYLKDHTITKGFLEHLAALKPDNAVQILERVADLRTVYPNPMEIFSAVSTVKAARKIPTYCVLTRSANITPTMIHVATPMVETSNRIVRKHSAIADRFIRIKFTDEKTEGPIYCARDDKSKAVFKRIKRAMDHGIVIAGRYYEFLAFGNSQFREHGAYFYAATPTLSADDIRKSMGRFDHIKSVAKFGARLGQCFSTTRAITSIKVKIEMIKDVERNGYTFTDGVGRISPLLAQLSAQELGLQNPFESPPSLFQFRLGGCKGVLALDPKISGSVVHIRPSQYKFEAQNVGLEIIRSSAFATAYLNRQLIIILSTLGVPDSIFLRKQQEMIDSLEQATKDEKVALDNFQRNVDLNQTTVTIVGMIRAGFMKQCDPFMMSILHLWRAYNIKYLKEKARIQIKDGAFLLGCVDETATLRGHYNDPQSREGATKEEKLATLPEIFVQITDTTQEGHHKVVEGVCVLARNPSLHPGDIRIVRAVDVPALHHLKDVIVLPQTGDRDIANMCSGGDLDGDDYMVIWDKDLLPKSINEPPMDFTSEQPIESEKPVTVADITEFFISYMKNDSLPQIATAHLAQADSNNAGSRSDICIELSRLHSKAVDYPKTGVPATMARELRPRQWPHFQAGKNRPKKQIYKSTKILGKLFDRVELVDFKPQYENAFDSRILNAFKLDEATVEQAKGIKIEYDCSLRRLMAKHEVCTEFEAWSVFVLDHNMETRDYTFADEFGRTVGILKNQYAEVCCEAAGASNKGDYVRLAPFVAAMYVVTAREVGAALEEKVDPTDMPLMSFPWIFPRDLGKIANNNTTDHEWETAQHQGRGRRHKKQMAPMVDVDSGIGEVETKEGVTHYGEVLKLNFNDSIEKDHTSGRLSHTVSATERSGSQGAISSPQIQQNFEGKLDVQGESLMDKLARMYGNA